MELRAGQIVTVDWRKDPDHPAQDPQPPEPNKLRPAVVVQDTELPRPDGGADHRRAELTQTEPMTVNRESLEKLGRFVLRGLRIGASTVSIVELLRNDWTDGISAGVAWLVFLQVERQLPPVNPEPED